jgi:MazG family protein
MVRFLRVNCPWDAEQTPRSLLPYLLEEAHEVAHHVDDGDDDALASELGDLLLHVAFQAALADERGAFAPHEPAERVLDKMRRRHPHLFGLGEKRDWEELKAHERSLTAEAFSHLDGLAKGLDPLALAHRIQDRVASVGFDWDDASGAWQKVREEIEEVAELAEARDRAKLEEEIGDLLFAVVNFARLSGVHAGLALGDANRKFTRRFQALEQLAPQRGVKLGEASLEELDRLWDEVKERERGL